MAQQTSPYIDRYGRPGRLKTKRLKEFATANEGEWLNGTFVFRRRQQCEADAIAAVRHSPTVGRISTCLTSEYSGRDSGFGMLRYPMPMSVSGDPSRRFPALSRMGSGL